MAKRRAPDAPTHQIINVDGTRYRTQTIRKYEERKKWEKEDPNKVTAMIPGTIVKIMVKEGQKVTKGKCLFILEAMKMKNRFNAEQNGYIEKIHVNEGDIIPKEHLVMEYGEPPAKTPKSRLSIRK